jgi:hypothetical protein
MVDLGADRAVRHDELHASSALFAGGTSLMRSRVSASRGQALVETVVYLPMLLFVFFGILWSIRAAVQYERIEQAVRYATLFQEKTPYTDFSLLAMYSQLGSPAAPPVPCASPIASQLSDGAPYSAMPSSTVTSPPIFTPSSVQLTQCTTTGYPYGLGGSAPGTVTLYTINGHTYTHIQVEDDVLAVEHPAITALVDVPSYLQNPLGSLTTIASSNEYFEHGANIAQLMFCYNPHTIQSLNSQVTNTINWANDPSPIVITTPFPAAPPPQIPIAASGNCTYNGPQ